MAVKAWILRSARLRCPYCKHTIYMSYKGRWSIHRAFSSMRDLETDSPTPQSPSLSLPEDHPERDEGEEAGDGA